jgi:regulatory protein
MAGRGDASGIESAGSDAATARALELAYRYVGRRERTTQELRRHLSARDLDSSVVDAVTAELTEAGYVDDARYARLFAEDKRRLEQWGSGRIRSALLNRGIEPDVVDAALSDESELSRALAVLRRRFPQPPRERRDRQRALGVLVRRGYELDLARDAIAAYRRDGA